MSKWYFQVGWPIILMLFISPRCLVYFLKNLLVIKEYSSASYTARGNKKT